LDRHQPRHLNGTTYRVAFIPAAETIIGELTAPLFFVMVSGYQASGDVFSATTAALSGC
jgi:hypothetical protein